MNEQEIDFKRKYSQFECGNCALSWGEEHEDGTGERSIEYSSGDICPNCNYSQKEIDDVNFETE